MQISTSLKLKCLYFFCLAAKSCVFVLLPIFFKTNGMTESQTGILLALRPFISFWSSPFSSGLADSFNSHSTILLCAICLSSFVRYFFLALPGFHFMVCWIIIASILDSPIEPIIDTFVMKQLDDVIEYGTIRLWGACGFGSLSLISGLIVSETSLGWNGMFGLYWLCMLLTFLFSFLVVRENLKCCHSTYLKVIEDVDEEPPVHSTLEEEMLSGEAASSQKDSEPNEFPGTKKIKLKNENIEDSEAVEINDENLSKGNCDAPIAGTPPPSSVKVQKPTGIHQELFKIIKVPRNVMFFFILLVGGFSQGIIECFLYIHLKDLGGNEALMGLARGVTGVAAMICFRYASFFIKILGEHGVLGFALLMFIVRFVYFTLLQYLPLWAILPAETLHGFTYSTLWVASTSIGFKIAPTHLKTTLQGIITGLHAGVGFGSGALVGGYIFEAYGAEILFQFGAIVVGTGLFCFLLEKGITRIQLPVFKNAVQAKELALDESVV